MQLKALGLIVVSPWFAAEPSFVPVAPAKQ